MVESDIKPKSNKTNKQSHIQQFLDTWSCCSLKTPKKVIGEQYGRARENRKNSRSGPKLRILDRFQTPQNANKSVQQVCALNPIFPQPTNFLRVNDV